jgi:hypothetical protein
MNFTIDFISKSPTLPAINIPCYSAILDSKTTTALKDFVIAEEPNMLANIPVPDFIIEPDWLTTRLWNYTLLDYDIPEIHKLKEWIGQQYVEYIKSIGSRPEPVYIRMWANVCHPGGRIIEKHNHIGTRIGAPAEHCYIAGSLFVGECEDTKTYFQNPFLETRSVGIPNIAGHMIMFPSYVNHWIDGTKGPLIRVSIAYDLITQYAYDLIQETVKNFRPLLW